MKNTLYITLICSFILACKTSKTAKNKNTKTPQEINLVDNDTVKIASDKTEYEIVIIEPGFNFWVNASARPRNFYSQQFLENRNNIYVIEWNQRVLQPQQFDPSLYELQINYQYGTDYGYEVNYLLYNYFIYFQLTYNQRLGPFVPRI